MIGDGKVHYNFAHFQLSIIIVRGDRKTALKSPENGNNDDL
jgi:hypothetical protein